MFKVLHLGIAVGFAIGAQAVASPITVAMARPEIAVGAPLGVRDVFTTSDGQLTATVPACDGESANDLRSLTLITLQAGKSNPTLLAFLGQPERPEPPRNSLIAYAMDADLEALMALSKWQDKPAEEVSLPPCALCARLGTLRLPAKKADRAPDEFEPLLYAAAAPSGPPELIEPDTSASVEANPPVLQARARPTAVLLATSFPDVSATYFFICGGVLLLVARIRHFHKR